MDRVEVLRETKDTWVKVAGRKARVFYEYRWSDCVLKLTITLSNQSWGAWYRGEDGDEGESNHRSRRES